MIHMNNLVDEARTILQNYVDKEHQGVKSRAASALGLSNITLGQWLNGSRIPNLEALSPVFAKLGIGFSLPAREPDRDVCFVNARVVPAGEGIEPPQAEDYIAAPMVGELGAGPGYVPQEEVRSWFLAYKNHPAVRFRRNLLAVEIGKDSDSMQPTLNPGDIVLVDRDDRNVQHAGHMMLVLDPDGNGMIKRVSVEDQSDGDSRITFYSDNAARHAPLVFSLREDYLSDWERAIVGRVIWAWADVREK